jgi:ATP-dependent Lhr-like helicase
LFGIEDAGRWTLVRRPSRGDSRDVAIVEHVAHALLRRYGVVFWKLTAREAAWLPPWRELLRVLRRLEARGEIRGGRFVASVSGEQFALPEAVTLLRETRKSPAGDPWLSLSAADPLNLVGTVLPGPKVAALASNRVLLRDGVAVAALVGGEIQWLERLDPPTAHAAEDALVRRRAGSPLLAYLR